MANIYAVIGLGFGDEGKGNVVSKLAHSLIKERRKPPLVIRYSGGSNAGHRVCSKQFGEHVFCQIGSGAFSEAPTYRGPDTLFDPVSLVNEMKAYLSRTDRPEVTLYVDPQSQVILPHDTVMTRNLSRYKEHGTTGTGMGAAIDRGKAGYGITALELLEGSREVLKIRLKLIEEHYYGKMPGPNLILEEQLSGCTEIFLNAVETVFTHRKLTLGVAGLKFAILKTSHDNAGIVDIILEGTQGVMLDEKTGFFPHVTRGRTGIAGAEKIIQKTVDIIGRAKLFIHYVLRHYETRHGNGPCSEDNVVPVAFVPADDGKDPFNDASGYQGQFRIRHLNHGFIGYAAAQEYSSISGSEILCSLWSEKRFVFTCADRMSKYGLTALDGKLRVFDTGAELRREAVSGLNESTAWYTDSPYMEDTLHSDNSGV